jgi:hypothetical protein
MKSKVQSLRALNLRCYSRRMTIYWGWLSQTSDSIEMRWK